MILSAESPKEHHMTNTPVAINAATEEQAKPEKFKPTKILPTDRIAYPKQLELLKAYASKFSNTQRAVTNGEVAEIIQMNVSTVSLANPFFSNVGLLNKLEGGYQPSNEVMAYFRADQWDKDSSVKKLAPLLREQWFSQAILPTLALRSMTEQETLRLLSDACNAGPNYKPQLKVLLSYLDSAGIIAREGDQVAMIKNLSFSVGESMRQTDSANSSSPSSKPTIQTEFTQSPQGGVDFNVSIHVDMKEFGGWQPDRISKFFSGIAEVLAAKAGVEKIK
jgi:hypothetical protein